ncbi:uncharacterized protein LOC119276019 isoform X2 [Triticum dicoccoides]|uniref:uncharacterized protein LOC119276019 isoform X2 n=1 Tax=Triticum dicoccoides TaxID=85692 RepID=UPI00188F55C2|nr:uncharacterized protein LOC119276019 isoform X2 [Triticum dicoccoides]XP_044348740.1 uncharacterized protein LOC123069858 isoform X2 [Triticum aestivum]XP_044348741.1 uncharacterized protein LOC123069858 isoform X2 [Triticum aestivum]XP_044348742.1 uncharacterized protein LOC123069858 isoform X2 [Triticum aestivum]
MVPTAGARATGTTSRRRHGPCRRRHAIATTSHSCRGPHHWCAPCRRRHAIATTSHSCRGPHRWCAPRHLHLPQPPWPRHRGAPCHNHRRWTPSPCPPHASASETSSDMTLASLNYQAPPSARLLPLTTAGLLPRENPFSSFRAQRRSPFQFKMSSSRCPSRFPFVGQVRLPVRREQFLKSGQWLQLTINSVGHSL